MIAETKVASSPPQFIEFGPPGQKTKDVLIDNITDLAHLYWVNNSVNDVFNLKINYGIGTYKMPILEPASEYISLVAPFSMTFADYSKELQMLGGTLNVSASEDYLTVEIIGPEPNIKPILKLIGRLLSNPSLDDRKIKNLYESYRVVEKMNKKDPETLGYALYSYAVYGKESEFLKGLSAKEIKKLKAADLTYAILTALTYEADFHYSGTLDFEQVKENINIHLNPKKIVNKSQSPVKKNYVAYSEPQVFFLEESSALQSKNYMFIKGNTITEKEKPLLNAYYEYLDGGMSSIIFQEIREYRSLAYATGASLFIPFYKDEETSLTSFVGTQADKTQEAIQVMHQIITSQPEKSNRIDMVRSSLTQSINSKKPPFRQISYPVAGWIKQGYDEDPRKKWVNVYETMSFDDIIQTFNNQFYKKPVITTIIGKKKRIGSEWMKEFGKITEVKKKDIIK
jgi:predicted Zn-dependent peptidase